MDDKQLLELISVFLEELGFDVEYVDGELYIDDEDSNSGMKVTVEVVS